MVLSDNCSEISEESLSAVFVMILFVLTALIVAGAVFIYVAYPYRGEVMPWHPEVAEALKRGVEAMPILDSTQMQHPAAPERPKAATPEPLAKSVRLPRIHFKRRSVSISS